MWEAWVLFASTGVPSAWACGLATAGFYVSIVGGLRGNTVLMASLFAFNAVMCGMYLSK